MNFIARLIFACAAVTCCAGLVLSTGCQKSTVDAVARTSKSKPVFGTTGSAGNTKKSGDIDFSFVHPDHFACLSFDVKRIISREEFDEVPWDALEERLAELVGDANADLSSIKRVWLLLDRESVSSVMEGKTESSLGGLFTAVIQYRSAPDLEQLAIAASKEIAKVESLGDEDDGEIGESSSNSKEEVTNAVDQPELQLVAESISETHVAIGSSLMVGKMKNAQKRIENSELSRLLTQIEFSSDVEGVIATGPIRDTLRSLFAMAAQFGGKKAKKLRTLPDVLEQIEISISLEQEDTDLVSIKAMIDDKRMVEEIVREFQQAIKRASEAKGKTGAAAEVFGQAFKQEPGAENLASKEVAEQVSREIQEKQLLKVESGDNSVLFRLGRPTKISELVRAIVSDSMQEVEPAGDEQAKQ